MAETEQAPSSSGRNIFRSTTRIVLLGFGVGAGYGIAAWIIVALIGAVQDFTDGQSLSSVVKPLGDILFFGGVVAAFIGVINGVQLGLCLGFQLAC